MKGILPWYRRAQLAELRKEKGVKVILELGPASRERGSSRMTVFADSYLEALQALMDIHSGKIDMRKIPKTGLDIRTK